MSRTLPGLGLGALRCALRRPISVAPVARPLSSSSATSKPRLTSSSSIPSTSLLTKERVTALWARQPHPAAPAATMTHRLLQRAFSSSPLGRIRDHYNRSSGSGSPPPRPGVIATIRARVNRWNPTYVVYAIMALNLIIFLAWQYAISSWQRFRDPALYNWLWKNFILSIPNITEGRIWTLITSTFSQMSTSHILLNMLGLYFMGPAVAGLLGAFNFLGLYIGGGLFASMCSLLYQMLNRNKHRRVAGSEGASGAIYACLAFFGTIFPQATFLLFFVIPAKAWMVVTGIFIWDFYHAITSRQGLTDSAGHAGGIAFGVASGLYARQKYLGSWRRSFRL
ncbi:hypothetical protein CspeluHIS016_0106720 [Cutaneotrichosporon spelunceum]|uniref:Peptidase S54 rhomboid domain-containing protein n=1 Tax=Cutaneotrichosporon spelunceum TaxID=1672016 RepID=A0AAD3TNF3_9TREE|nr:hypothetical protein CspeluHIS016_0106720 [Cutaneotrichosporon spelunceum]